MKKKFSIVLFLSIILLLFGINLDKVDASSENRSNLEFKLNRVLEFGDSKYLSIEINNKTEDIIYSFGWVRESKLIVETTDGKFEQTISNEKIYSGKKTCSYMVSAPGELQNLYFSDVRQLNDKGLPMEGSLSPYVLIDDYTIINGTTVILIAAVSLVSIILLIVFIRRKASSPAYVIGNTFIFIGMTLFAYGFYGLVIKPIITQLNYPSFSYNYFIFAVTGIIINLFGQLIKSFGGKRRRENNRYSNYNNNYGGGSLHYKSCYNDNIKREEQNIDQINQLNESNILYQETVKREQQEQINKTNQEVNDQIYRTNQEVHDQINRDFDSFNRADYNLNNQNIDDLNNQQINDFNQNFEDFNNFNNNNFW